MGRRRNGPIGNPFQQPDPMEVYGPPTYDQMYPMERPNQMQEQAYHGRLPEHLYRAVQGQPSQQDDFRSQMRASTGSLRNFLPEDLVRNVNEYLMPRMGPQTFQEYANEQYPGVNLPAGTNPEILNRLVRRDDMMPAIRNFFSQRGPDLIGDPAFRSLFSSNAAMGMLPQPPILPGGGAEAAQAWNNMYFPYSVSGNNPYMIMDPMNQNRILGLPNDPDMTQGAGFAEAGGIFGGMGGMY